MKRKTETREELLATLDISELNLDELKVLKKVFIRQQRYNDAAKLRDMEKLLQLNIYDKING